MAKVPYKASKAWHFGHQLATEIHGLSDQIVAAGETDLAKSLHQSTLRISDHLANSYQKSLETEKARCYSQAHEAASELQSHLALLNKLEVINSKTMKRWQRQADTIAQQLLSLLPESQPAIVAEAVTEENYGTINNQSEERDSLPVRRPALPRRGLQPESDGARRINR